MDGFYRAPDGIDEIRKDPADVLPYSIDWYERLRGDDIYWAPRLRVHPGQTCTPPAKSINGHRYLCTIGGQTGSTEPSWTTAGSTPFTDGAATWARIGTEDTISTSNWAAETGLTAGSGSIDTSGRVTVITLSVGTAGRQYLVTNTVTTAQSKTIERRFRVRVEQR